MILKHEYDYKVGKSIYLILRFHHLKEMSSFGVESSALGISSILSVQDGSIGFKYPDYSVFLLNISFNL